jgi:hypothetical protein
MYRYPGQIHMCLNWRLAFERSRQKRLSHASILVHAWYSKYNRGWSRESGPRRKYRKDKSHQKQPVRIT